VWKHFEKQPVQEVPLPVRDLRQYTHYNKSSGGGGMSHSLSKIQFRDSGWADNGLSIEGYVRDEKFQYQRSDLWFCLIPALYLLVPGCSVWKIAFFSIVDAADGGPIPEGDTNGQDFSLQALISGVFVIGIAQVIGVRLALATLWICQELMTTSPSSSS
jgi:hypothetical protein